MGVSPGRFGVVVPMFFDGVRPLQRRVCFSALGLEGEAPAESTPVARREPRPPGVRFDLEGEAPAEPRAQAGRGETKAPLKRTHSKEKQPVTRQGPGRV